MSCCGKKQRTSKVGPIDGNTSEITENKSETKTGITKLREEMVIAHNAYRKKHGAPPMRQSDDLNSMAQKWAEYLANTNKFEHSSGHSVGENLWGGMGGGTPTGQDVTTAWYNEIQDYDFTKGGFSMKTGHFTQVVWKASVELGTGFAVKNGMMICCCNYRPAGNMMGSFGSQVSPVLSNFLQQEKKESNVLPIPETKRDEVTETTPKLLKIREEIVLAHNDYRKRHGAPAMKQANDLNNMAQKWAEYLAKNNKFEHSSGNSVGENLWGGNGITPTGQYVTACWYDEMKDYDFTSGGFSMKTGHFTQVVWKKSVEIGTGFANNNGYMVCCCNYRPAGNMIGDFDNQVSRILSDPSSAEGSLERK